MKSGLEHKVPLVRQSVALLKRLSEMSDSLYLFPAPGGGPLSDMALLETVREMKAPCTPHGFRSSFKEWAREVQGAAFADEVSELSLAHVNSDETRAAYARGMLLDWRRKLLTKWAAFCYSGERSHA
jgi:integrase